MRALRALMTLGVTTVLLAACSVESSTEPNATAQARIEALQVEGGCGGGFRKVNVNGFGNPDNLYAWSMEVFGEHLYVGTLNNVTGPEIWRYDGSDWEHVFTREIATGNTGFRTLKVLKGQLYATTVNDSQGAELWRSADGVNWESVVLGGFGNPDNSSFRGLVEFRRTLFMGVQNQSGPGGQLWRSFNGTRWWPVSRNGLGDPTNHSLHAFVVFGGMLYVGTANDQLTQVFRSSNGRDFERVVGPGAAVPAGFGLIGTTNTVQLFPYGERLFVGTANNDYGFSLHVTTNGVDYLTLATEGAGNPDNNFSWRFASYDDYLWLGTGNFNPLKGEGGSVLRSRNGITNWETLVGDGGTYFDYGFNRPINWGIRTLAVYQNRLFIGTVQCWKAACDPLTDGTEIWEWSGDPCSDEDAGTAP
jgi:hypothetical protein